MASRLIRNQLPSNGLRVRPPCPPLLSWEAQGYRKGLWKKASRSTQTVVRRSALTDFESASPMLERGLEPEDPGSSNAAFCWLPVEIRFLVRSLSLSVRMR